MILVTENVLDAGELAWFQNLFGEMDARPGAETAEGELKRVKNNRQLALGERAGEVRRRMLDALNRRDDLAFALQPKSVSMPLLNVYGPGEGYGEHTDAHLGHTGQRYFRCDISGTIFLDDPGSYDGGELSLMTEEGWRTYKLPAGSAVFYPTQYVHRVNEVRHGKRRACVMWIESFVRDPTRRRMLYELQHVRSWIESTQPLEAPHRQMLVNVCENLHRMWVET